MSFIDLASVQEAMRERTEKRCQSCKEILPLSAFYADKGRVDGHEYLCIECSRIKRAVKRPRGRPEGTTLPPAQKKSVRVQANVEPHLWEFVQSEAVRHGLTPAEYIRETINREYIQDQISKL